MKINRENKNTIILAIIINMFMVSGLSTIIVLGAEEDVFDLTRYDAESDIIGFIPLGDSGLDYNVINEIPIRELRAPYDKDDASAKNGRVLFKIGEWELKEDLTEIEEYILEDDTKLVKSSYYLETDLISWTDLDFRDVYMGGDPNRPLEKQNSFKWCNIKKQLGRGIDAINYNSLIRITIWNNDLYKIIRDVGGGTSSSKMERGVDIIQGWKAITTDDDIRYPKKYADRYGHLKGLKYLADNDRFWQKKYYEKYLRWNEINLPNYDYNIRNWGDSRWNDLSVQGYLYFDVDLKESLWSKLEFPNTVEVEGEGKYTKDRVVLAVDSITTLGPEEEGSRTRIEDLQERYDEVHSPHSALGNMLSTDPKTDPFAIKEEDRFNGDAGRLYNEVPKDTLGDGVDVSEVISYVAQWDWKPDEWDHKATAELPGTNKIDPMIWEGEELPSSVSIGDIDSLKPLDSVDKITEAYGMNIKDRSYAVFSTYFEYGPYMKVKYARLTDVKTVNINLAMQLWGGHKKRVDVTTKCKLEHIPYDAQVHNMGLAQTLRLKVVALSNYKYEPYDPEDPDVPQFPYDDTELDWPATIEDGGETAFQQWTETPNWLDALLGWFQQLFGAFWWIILPFVIGLIAIVVLIIFKKVAGDAGGKKSMKKMERLMLQQMDLERMKAASKSPQTETYHITGGPVLKSTRVVLVFSTGLGIFALVASLYIVF